MNKQKAIKILNTINEECWKHIKCEGCPFYLEKEEYCIFEYSLANELVKCYKEQNKF